MDNTELLHVVRSEGLDDASYLALMAEQAGADPAALPADEAERLEYTRLNLHRTERIARNWTPSAELAAALAEIRAPQLWMVLTEPWCGDSAQCLPVIAKLAATGELTELRIVLRDAHPEIMDRYLTDGKRSIPRLVAFADDGRELGTWGPRPRAAQEVFAAAQAEGLEKPAILEKLHLWYGRDRGAALDGELLDFVRQVRARAERG